MVSTFLWGPGAFLPRPEDRRQPPFLDQLYASNGGCSTTMCHRLGAGALQRGRGEEAGWPAAPPGRLVARAAPATLRARHAQPRLALLPRRYACCWPATLLIMCSERRAGPRSHRAARDTAARPTAGPPHAPRTRRDLRNFTAEF